MRERRSFLLLLAIALMSLAAATNNYFFLLAATVLSFAISLYLIYRLFASGQATRFFLLSSLTCGAWTTAGFLQSGIYLLRQDQIDFAALFLRTTVTIDVRDYALAFAYLFLFIFCSLFVSRLPPLIKAERVFARQVIDRLQSVKLQIWAISLLLVSTSLAIVSFLGLISIRGLASEFYSDQGVLPWWYVLVQFLVSLLPLLISQLFYKLKHPFSFEGLIAISGFVIGLYYSSLFGRFSLLSFLLLVSISWLVIQRPALRFTTKQLVRCFLVALILILLLPMANSLFAFINIARSQRGLYTDPLMFLSSYLDFATSADVVRNAVDDASENLAARPLVLWPLAASIKMSFVGLNSGYLYFDDLFNSALNSLPRFLYQEKQSLLLQQTLLYSRFPFSDVDTADSPYLYAFASFGLLGALIYPLVIAITYFLFIKFIAFACHYGVSLLTNFAGFSALLAFSVVSYGELDTTALFRLFVVPIAISIVAMSPALLFSRRHARPDEFRSQ